MAVTYGFYNSLNKDRVYNAEQMSAIFDGVITDGVFASIADHMMPVAGTGLQVIVKPGKCWFNHTWTLNDAELPLTIATADVSLTRIDAIVVEINSAASTRANSIKVIKGTPSANPTKPALTNTETLHQYALGYIKVTPGMTSVTADKIEVNVGKTGCPFVTSVLQQTDITDLFNQWDAEFNAWFENVQSQLSGNVAANLQRQIDERVKISDKATDEDISNKTPDKWVDAEHGAKLKGYVYDETTKTYGHIVTTGIGFSKKYDINEKLSALHERPLESYISFILGHFAVFFEYSTRFGDSANAGRILVLDLKTGVLTNKMNISSVHQSGSKAWYIQTVLGGMGSTKFIANVGNTFTCLYDVGVSSSDCTTYALNFSLNSTGNDIVITQFKVDTFSRYNLSCNVSNYPLVSFDDYILQPNDRAFSAINVYKKTDSKKIYNLEPNDTVSFGSSDNRPYRIIGNPGRNIIITLSQFVANDGYDSYASLLPIVEKIQLTDSAKNILASRSLTVPSFPGKSGQMLVPICYDDNRIYFVYCWSKNLGSRIEFYLYKKIIAFDIQNFVFVNTPSTTINDYIQDNGIAYVLGEYVRSVVLGRDSSNLYFTFGLGVNSDRYSPEILHANTDSLNLDICNGAFIREYINFCSSSCFAIPKVYPSGSRFQYCSSMRLITYNSDEIGYDPFFDMNSHIVEIASNFKIPTIEGVSEVGIMPYIVLAPDYSLGLLTIYNGVIYQESDEQVKILYFTAH